MSMKVGELYGELGLDDLMSKQLDQAEAKFKKVAKGLDAEARLALGLDQARLTADLAKAKKDVARLTKEIANAPVGLDTSDMVADLARAQSKVEATAREISGIKMKLAAPEIPPADVSDVDAGASEGASSILDMIGGWTTVGVGAAAGLGLAVGKSLIDAIGEVIDRGALNDKITAALGYAVQGERDRTTKLIRDLFTDGFGGSYEEAGKAISAVLSTTEEGLTATDGQVTAIAQQAQTVADIFGVDVADAVLDAQVLVRNGLAPDMLSAFDLIVAGARGIPDALKGDFFEILTQGEYVAAFKALGISGEEAFGLLQESARGGSFILDKVGDAFKELTIRGSDMSESTRNALGTIGLDAEEISRKIIAGGESGREAFDQIVDGLRGIDDPAVRSQTAIALLGTQMEDLGISDLDAVLSDLDSMDSKLVDVEGAATRAGEVATDNFASKWDTAMRHFNLGSLADTFSRDGFEGLRAQLGEGVDSLAEIWDTYGPAVKEILGEGWDQVVEWWDDPEGGQKVLDQAETWWNETALPALGDAAGEALSGAWDAATSKLGDIVTDPETWVSILDNLPVQALGQVMSDKFTEVVDGMPEWLGGIIDQVETFLFETLPPKIRDGAANLWDAIPEAFKSALNSVIGFWNGLRIPEYQIGPWEIPTSPWTTQRVGPFTLGGIDFPDIPMFHTGGQVDVPGGGPGAEMMAVLQKGERVLTAGQQSALDRFLGGQAGGGQAGPLVWIENLHVDNPVNGTPDEMATAMNTKLGWKLSTATSLAGVTGRVGR